MVAIAESPGSGGGLGTWQGFRLLRDRDQAALVASNALTGIGTGMQLLIQGWLAISWGHSAWFLTAFAASRIVPKLLLTVPAGIFCDRAPRVSILMASRWLKAVSSLLPLFGFIFPHPLLWVLGASALAGAAQAFEVPAGRSTLGDITPRSQLTSAVALNSAAGHLSALCSPALAFGLVQGAGRPLALMVSAAVLAAAALSTASLPVVETVRTRCERPDLAGLVRYLLAAPMVIFMILATLLPSLIDRGFVLLLPSMSDSGRGAIGVALIAPDLGALLAATALAMLPVKLSVRFLLFAVLLYTCFMVNAMRWADTPPMLIAALGLAGMAKLALTVSVLSRMQHEVPSDLRGRVMAF